MKRVTHLMIVGVFLLFTASCKKTDSGSGGTYPRQVSITYRVSSITTNSLVLITYDNESGGQATVGTPVLPFTKTISRTVSKYTVITVGFAVNPAQTVKLEILVNNTVVKSQEYTAANSAMSYTFQ